MGFLSGFDFALAARVMLRILRSKRRRERSRHAAVVARGPARRRNRGANKLFAKAGGDCRC
jgi:hypothetical protein